MAHIDRTARRDDAELSRPTDRIIIENRSYYHTPPGVPEIHNRNGASRGMVKLPVVEFPVGTIKLWSGRVCWLRLPSHFFTPFCARLSYIAVVPHDHEELYS